MGGDFTVLPVDDGFSRSVLFCVLIYSNLVVLRSKAQWRENLVSYLCVVMLQCLVSNSD